MNHFSRIHRTAALLSAVAAATLATAAPVSAEDSFKLGIVTFLSGPAADSFGVPARNGGPFRNDPLNKAGLPAPYNQLGFGGVQLLPGAIHRNGGGAEKDT